jgi:hypothetical protein
MALTQVEQSMIIQPVTSYGPAFAAYLASTQTVASGTPTKVSLANEIFDTNNCFDTTLFRFLPTVAGYYEFTGRLLGNSTTASSYSNALLYKNGALTFAGPVFYSSGTNNLSSSVSGLIYLNGTTDYVELWGTQSGTDTNTFMTNSSNTYFAGFLARPA